MGKTLYLLRHGDTGARGRFIGSTDLPITPEAKHQLQSSARLLKDKAITSVICSPMTRCRQTAEVLRLDAEITYDERLREVDFGNWEEMTFDDIAAGWPEKVDEWARWSEDFTFPGGENMGGFLARIKDVSCFVNESAQENMLLITHGGVIRQLICHYLGISHSSYLLFEVKAGMFTTLSLHSNGGILTSLNSG